MYIKQTCFFIFSRFLKVFVFFRVVLACEFPVPDKSQSSILKDYEPGKDIWKLADLALRYIHARMPDANRTSNLLISDVRLDKRTRIRDCNTTYMYKLPYAQIILFFNNWSHIHHRVNLPKRITNGTHAQHNM